MLLLVCAHDGVSTVTFEIWPGGGGGAGMTCCNYCMFLQLVVQEVTTLKTIDTNCKSILFVLVVLGVVLIHTCTAGMGCKSYVNGHNLIKLLCRWWLWWLDV